MHNSLLDRRRYQTHAATAVPTSIRNALSGHPVANALSQPCRCVRHADAPVGCVAPMVITVVARAPRTLLTAATVQLRELMMPRSTGLLCHALISTLSALVGQRLANVHATQRQWNAHVRSVVEWCATRPSLQALLDMLQTHSINCMCLPIVPKPARSIANVPLCMCDSNTTQEHIPQAALPT